MSSLHIRISITKLTNYSAHLKRRFNKKTLLLIIESFSRYVMHLYLSLVEEAINSNRYKGNWEPISDDGYREYLGTEPTGDIFLYIEDAIEVKKIGNNFIIRLDPEYKYPGSKLSLGEVVTAIEYGTSKFNSRPILRRVLRKINSHIIDLWEGYLFMKNIM